MKIVVIGGDGLVGSKLVERLRQGAHMVVSASPSTGVNAMTGDGLPEAMEGTHVVIDVASSAHLNGAIASQYFQRSGQNVFAAERAARVSHHITLSVVGARVMAHSGYFRAKYDQEEMTRRSGIPHTILRATQLFELMSGIAGSNTQSPVVRLPPALTMPLSVDDVVEELSQLAMRPGADKTIEMAGPEVFRLCDVVARVLAEQRDERLVVADASARYFDAIPECYSLLPENAHRIAPTSFEQWLGTAIRSKY